MFDSNVKESNLTYGPELSQMEGVHQIFMFTD